MPWPFNGRRRGQQEVTDHATSALGDGRPLLVQAPTGMGKTAALLSAALQHVFTHDQQLFWATSRNTQQATVAAAVPLSSGGQRLGIFAAAGQFRGEVPPGETARGA